MNKKRLFVLLGILGLLVLVGGSIRYELARANDAPGDGRQKPRWETNEYTVFSRDRRCIERLEAAKDADLVDDSVPEGYYSKIAWEATLVDPECIVVGEGVGIDYFTTQLVQWSPEMREQKARLTAQSGGKHDLGRSQLCEVDSLNVHANMPWPQRETLYTASWMITDTRPD